MKELSLNYEEMEWQDARGYPSGTKIKILWKVGESQTFLLKLQAGFNMRDHAHLATEQHFVLYGEYESEGRKYSSGTYRHIPANTNHGPFVSEQGAVVLVVWNV